MNTSGTWKDSLSKSFFNAFRGFAYLIGHRNFLIGVFVTLIGVPIVWLVDRCFVYVFLLFSALVLGLEAINSALEELIDHIHPRWHSTVGRVKDMLAAATVLAVMFAFISAVLEAGMRMGVLGVLAVVAAAGAIYIIAGLVGGAEDDKRGVGENQGQTD